MGRTKTSVFMEFVREIYTEAVTVGATAVEIPTNILDGRRFLSVQNIHASNILYVGTRPPQLLKVNQEYRENTDLFGTPMSVNWKKSAGGTNEYYAVSKTGGNPGLTECLRLYGITSDGGEEAVLTKGTIASLANLGWAWGDGDTLGYSTVYFRINAGDPDDLSYLQLFSYIYLPTSVTAFALVTNDTFTWHLGSGCRIFAIASGAGTVAITGQGR